jgi:dipicolinate synthase subunit A
MKMINYAVIGGDLRNVILCNLLIAEKADVKSFGISYTDMEKLYVDCETLNEAIMDRDVIIGPLPCSNDDETLNAPFHKEAIYIKDILKAMNGNQLFIAGRISDKTRRLADIYGIKIIDYLEREEMAVLNAIPTSEGAIQIAMEEMPITLHGSRAMVLGFGRIGKILSKMLSGIGADVYVMARKCHDLAWISGYGYKPVPLNKLCEFLPEIDVVFNTVPHLILDDEKLSYLKKNCTIIDLASKPGGIDLNAVKIRNIKTIWALSLPGKVAPMTAAMFIRETIRNILYEMEV